MYTNRFGLTEDPFRVTPNRRFLFLGDVHGPVISKLRSSLVRPHGLCLLSGAPGVGKTLALLQVAGMLPEGTPISFLYNAHLDLRGFLNAVLSHFGVDPKQDADVGELLNEIDVFVGHCRAGGRRPVVIVDEAGNLSPEVVSRLNELTKVHSDENQGVSVVLGSDLAHRDALVSQLGRDPDFTEITVDPLDPQEVAKYIEHRMRIAGWRDGAIFYESAVERIAEVSGGVPRIINTLAGKALFLTHLGGGQIVSRASVDEAARELWAVANTPAAVPEGGSMLVARLKVQQPGWGGGKGCRSLGGNEPVDASALNISDSTVLHHVERDSAPSQRVAGSWQAPAVTASRARRYAFLTAFALAAATFAAKMSTERGQDEVIETAEPVIENVNKMVLGIRHLVAPSDSTPEPEITHVDWAPSPRPIPVPTQSTRYVSLQEPADLGKGVTPAIPAIRVLSTPLADPPVATSKDISAPAAVESRTTSARPMGR